MFSLREFIKKGLLAGIGKMADFQIILNAAGWFEKGVLLEEDLIEIEAAIEAEIEARNQTTEDFVDIEAQYPTDDIQE